MMPYQNDARLQITCVCFWSRTQGVPLTMEF